MFNVITSIVIVLIVKVKFYDNVCTMHFIYYKLSINVSVIYKEYQQYPVDCPYNIRSFNHDIGDLILAFLEMKLGKL